MVIGLEKRKLAKKGRKENVPAVYWQEGKPAHGTEATGMLRNSAKKNELGTNKAQLNLTQHG